MSERLPQYGLPVQSLDTFEFAAITDEGEQFLISDDRALAAFTKKLREEGRGFVVGTAKAMFASGAMGGTGSL